MANDEKMSRQEQVVKAGKPLLKITTRIFTGKLDKRVEKPRRIIMRRNFIKKLDKRAEKPPQIPMVKTFIKKLVKKAVKHEITINKAKASRNPGGFHVI